MVEGKLWGICIMEDFKEQYRRELIYQEIKSNKRTLKGFIWFLAAVAFIWMLTMTGFFSGGQKAYYDSICV